MFELADRLVSIYTTHNPTKSVTINPKKFATKASLSASQAGAASQAAAAPAAPALGDATNQQAEGTVA